jgi:hypothetical protein
MAKEHDLYGQYQHLAVPREGERGYIPRADAGFDPYEVATKIARLWRDPEIGPMLDRWLRGGPEDEDPFAVEDLPELLGIPSISPDVALWVVEQVTSYFHEASPGDEAIEVEMAALWLEWLTLRGDRAQKPRLVIVSKPLALRFIRETHSELPEANVKGLLFTMGVMDGPHLAAVATLTSPTGPWRKVSPHSVLELSRIASDGTVRGASSMLAARGIDLLPYSGRYGHEGLLFVTYSLVREKGTTYLALADKGLRPVELTRGKKPGGARQSEGALKAVDKIRWEAGPAAGPPDWEALQATAAEPSAVAGAKKQFEAWQARQAGRSPRLSRSK